MKNVPKNLRFEVSPEEFREHLKRVERIEEKLIRFGNLCFHFPDNTKMVESNIGGDKVMSREEADSAIGICAIIDKNTSLLRENQKLKEELESFIIRCECLQKAKEELISQQAVIDGKPLSDGEKALIKELRRSGGIKKTFEFRATRLITELNHGLFTYDGHVAFLSNGQESDDKAIIAALKQIKSEQENND